MPMEEIVTVDDSLRDAAAKPFNLFERIRALKESDDIHLHLNRVFSCIQSFGERVVGDALAIFDEFAFPKVQEAEVGQDLRFQNFVISVLSSKVDEIRTLVSDLDGKPSFQVEWADNGKCRSIRLRESPVERPTYPYASAIASASLIHEEDFGIHPVGSGHMGADAYFKTMDALSLLRPELLAHVATRVVDPAELNHRRMNLISYEKLLQLDGGVAGPACHWAMMQIWNWSLCDVMDAAADRLLQFIPEVEKLNVEWGKSYFSYQGGDEYLTRVPTDVPGRKAIFSLFIDWCFKHQALLAVLDFDKDGEPKEATFNLISRGNGEFLKIAEAVKEGQFVGMPVARYFYRQRECVVAQEFVEAHGFDVLTSVMRHAYSFVAAHNRDTNEDAEIITDFSKLLELDLDDEFENDGTAPDSLGI